MTVAAGTVTSWARQCEAVTDAATRWSFLTACRRVTVTVTGSDWHGRARASLSRRHGRGASARSALKLPELQACLKCTCQCAGRRPACQSRPGGASEKRDSHGHGYVRTVTDTTLSP